MGFEDSFDLGGLVDLALENESMYNKVAEEAHGLELQKLQELSLVDVWCNSSVAPLECLLNNVLCDLRPRQEDYNIRFDFVRRLSDLLGSYGILKGVVVVPYGSFESDLFHRWADLDLCLEFPNNDTSYQLIPKAKKIKFLRTIVNILKIQGQACNMQFIPHARVPVVSFEEIQYKISCDLCVENRSAFLKSRLLKWISQIDSRCRQLIFLVKCWAKAQGINEPKHGYLNSFSLCLLVVFHLQTRSPPILPPLSMVLDEDIARVVSGQCYSSMDDALKECKEKIDRLTNEGYGRGNNSSIGELFVSFFSQYSAVSHLWKIGLAVCPFSGKWGDRTTTDKLPMHKHYFMTVEDPFDRSENCARSVQIFTISNICDVFSAAAIALSHPPSMDALSLLRETLFCWPEGATKPTSKFQPTLFSRKYPAQFSGKVRTKRPPRKPKPQQQKGEEAPTKNPLQMKKKGPKKGKRSIDKGEQAPPNSVIETLFGLNQGYEVLAEKYSEGEKGKLHLQMDKGMRIPIKTFVAETSMASKSGHGYISDGLAVVPDTNLSRNRSYNFKGGHGYHNPTQHFSKSFGEEEHNLLRKKPNEPPLHYHTKSPIQIGGKSMPRQPSGSTHSIETIDTDGVEGRGKDVRGHYNPNEIFSKSLGEEEHNVLRKKPNEPLHYNTRNPIQLGGRFTPRQSVGSSHSIETVDRDGVKGNPKDDKSRRVKKIGKGNAISSSFREEGSSSDRALVDPKVDDQRKFMPKETRREHKEKPTQGDLADGQLKQSGRNAAVNKTRTTYAWRLKDDNSGDRL